jgi:hypothetical protein
LVGSSGSGRVERWDYIIYFIYIIVLLLFNLNIMNIKDGDWLIMIYLDNFVNGCSNKYKKILKIKKL